MAIKVMLADDHAVVRDGVKAIIKRLGREILIVGEASNGRQVLEQIEGTAVDVFVMDLEMPELDGIETLDRLARRLGPVKVIFLSMYDDKMLVERAIRSGAKGYLLKETAVDEIVRAIQEVYRGGYYFSPRVSGYLAQDLVGIREGEETDRLATSLTSRQTEILKRVCQGLTEKEIAAQLNISPNTVHVHVNNIMRKLDIHTKAGLIKYAIKMGVIQV